MTVDLEKLAEKIRQMLREQPVTDINVVVHGREVFASAKPHPETGLHRMGVHVRVE